MKRLFLSLSIALMSLSLAAQETAASPATNAGETQPQTAVTVPQYGYLSYNAVFTVMPEYQKAKEDFAALKAQYDAEAARAEEEFQRKFAEFLQGQKDFPKSILQKRQVELQELMDKSVSFRSEAQRLLTEAETKLQASVSERLNAAIRNVAAKRGLMFVLNTDNNAVPFVHPQVGVDITEAVLTHLGITPGGSAN